ncbi:hypothetical protein D3C76_1857480 [compost metagenome]
MSQPREGHGFDPVGVYAVSGGAADTGVWQQVGQAIHQRRVMGAAATDQQLLRICLGALQ